MPGTSMTTAPSPISIVNAWVFHDAWMGSLALTWNADCVAPSGPGCNGHRRAVLSRPPVPGARLYIDVTTKTEMLGTFRAVAVAALMVWKLTPPSANLITVQLP
jgi:hypothetical protein